MNFNNSTIKFTVEGDIIVNAKRHIVTRRRLSFDNCPDSMVAEAVAKYDEGPDAYNKYIERVNLEVDINSQIEQVESEGWLYD